MSVELRQFKEVVFDYSASMSPESVFVENKNLAQGLEAYRRNFSLGFELVLNARFRKLELFLGSEGFTKLVQEYVKTLKLEFYDIDLAPVGFAQFLQDRSTRFGSYGGLFADLARFEELKFLSMHTREILRPHFENLDFSRFFKLSDQIYVQTSEYNLSRLDELLEKFAKGELTDNIDISSLKAPSFSLIGRQDWYSAKVLAINPNVIPLIRALERGTYYVGLVGIASQHNISIELLNWLLQKLHQDGWLQWNH